MQEMVEAIRAAVTENATTEQKTSGALACRTLATALEAEIGKPIVLSGAPAPGPLAGISSDQALDLLIARLRAVAETREKAAATVAPTRNPEPSGLRIAFVQPPSQNGAPRAVRQSQNAAPRAVRRSSPDRPLPTRKA